MSIDRELYSKIEALFQKRRTQESVTEKIGKDGYDLAVQNILDLMRVHYAGHTDQPVELSDDEYMKIIAASKGVTRDYVHLMTTTKESVAALRPYLSAPKRESGGEV